MGVEYKHYAFVRGGYRPSAERVAGFIQALADERWIAPRRTMVANRVSLGRLPKAAQKTCAMLHGPGADREPAPFVPTAEWLRAKKPYVRLSWPMVDVLELGFRFPIAPLPYVTEYLYYDLEIHWSRHYLDIDSSDAEGPSFSGRCVCGASLELPKRPVLGPTFYRTRCTRCGENPAALGSGRSLHRFALVVDCGKNVPEADAPVALHPALGALCTRWIGARWNEAGTIC